jgi:putative phosphoesterase
LPRGTRRLPERCIAELRAAELILHGGDFTALSFLRELEALGRLQGVHGNMDDVEVRRLLPERRIVEAGGARIGMVHDAGPAAGRSERLTAAFPGCAAVVYGHSHLPEVSWAGDVWVLNPGSPTERRRAPWRSMLLLEIAGGEIRPRLLELP